ncbi:hypothetical protein, partial [Phocaeicola vulgatus]|uniref:hypothetical protein n=1 Tax=Phocaeicola vulgatus TaxID=821 RepID=UPI0032E495FA
GKILGNILLLSVLNLFLTICVAELRLFCFNAKKVKNILFFIQSGIVGLGIITFAIQLEIIQY